MHIVLHLIPGYHKTGSMGAEYRTGWIFQVCLRIISCLADDLLLIVAGLIIPVPQGQPSSSLCIGSDLSLIIPQIHHRPFSCKNRHIPFGFRRIKYAVFPLYICHCPSQILRRNLHTEPIIRLQQAAFSRTQPLAQSPVRRLAEIPSLCVLNMGPSG